MNIVTAVRRRLRDEPALVGMGRIDKHRLDVDVANTGELAVVVSYNGNWRSTMQTARFPRVGITIYADPTRVNGEVVAEDAEDRALDAWNVIDKVMHRPITEAVRWGGESGVIVLFSNRETEPSPIEHPISSTKIIRATYDLKVM